ncbi:toprim domain-containing protein [Tsuneonella sp. CC-YZS046]|uniref:toprim domain-containing protein n=1 Tax=Tsuneonella sp. CC-YZS046 TaxID=3042152 RepID=UPI002D79CBED|nr:toprim domain-containing protein [Tsuneonella sp. CC-YZS046]WRO66588.1 toprim domain-containing protein [Tsuneonella sp. CC-YZS046]
MTSDPVAAFLDAMEAAGVVPVEPIADRLGPDRIYFRCDCDSKKGRKTGWAKLYLDEHPAGSFGNYKLGIVQTWRLSNDRSLTRKERAEIEKARREAAAKRKEEQEAQWRNVSEACAADWERSRPVNPEHPYLVSKGIVGEGLRQFGPRLLVPMFDADGRLWNIQSIGPDGGKLYTKGGRATGLLMVLGEPMDRFVIAEGYGTAAVIKRATALPVVVAFTAANLVTVAKAMRDRFPDAEIVIAADDDAHLLSHPTIQRNIGVDAAQAAARAVGGRVALPPRRAA